MTRLPRWAVEAVVTLALFASAAWAGASYITASRAAGNQPFFYQQYFEPAVMMACGRGFVVSAPAPPPALQDFLNRTVDTFSCAAIPADQKVRADSIFQWAMFYLMLFVAVAWRVFGISWSGLAPAYGLLFGSVIALAYGIFRCGVGRAIAALCAVALTISTLHLANLPHLRDYAKAPFVLAHVLILAWLVIRRPRPWQLLTLAAAYGLVLGVGYGFRTDLLADILPFVLAAFAFLPGSVWKNIGLKLAMVGICAVVFVGTAWPVLRQVATGTGWGCQWHVVLLGLDADYGLELGLTPSVYQWNSAYSDEYIYTAVSSYHDRTRPPAHVEYCSPDYDAASGAYLRDIVGHFPGDMAIRGYAAALRVIDAPFPWYDAPLPDTLRWLYRPRGAVLKSMAGTARLATLLAIVMLGAYSLRLGLAALLFVVYFGGYPALQFANRHYFHLEFIGWWAMAFVLTQAIRLVRRRDAGDRPSSPREWRRLGLDGARFAAIAAAMLIMPLVVLRAYQHRQFDQLTARLFDAPRVEVPMVVTGDGHGLRLPGGAIQGVDYDLMRTAYLDVHLDLAACPAGVPLAASYDPTYPVFNFSGSIRTLPPGTKSERVLLPIYRYFQGFDLGTAPARCVTRVERLAFVRKLPLLPVLTLPHDWRTLPAHQSLGDIRWLPPLLTPGTRTGS